MKKNKKWLLLLIVIFPSAFWVILELSTINSKKLPHFGPKRLTGQDTVFYNVGDVHFYTAVNGQLQMKQYDTVNYPILVVSFLKKDYKKDGFRAGGLLDYTQYKKDDIDKMPILLIYPGDKPDSLYNVRDSLNIGLGNIEQCYWRPSSFDSINFAYFREKPVYIDYSFLLLLDKKRQIRGYYDGRYVAEVKRLLSEYKHLRIKEEKTSLTKENEIKTQHHE